jgi:Flp pilus assembly protein TadD
MPKPLGKRNRPPDVRPQLMQALDAETAGKIAEAERLYRAVLAIDPQNFAALNRQAVLCAGRGEKVEALRLIQAAMKANPASGETAADMGVILEGLGRIEEAIACYDRALVLRPKHPAALFNRGASLAKLRQYEKAIASYDKAIAVAPRHFEAHNGRGLALAEIGRHAEAIAAFTRAIEIDPSYKDAHFHRSLARLVLGEFEAGWDEYEWRWSIGDAKGMRPDYAIPDWNGEPLAGKTIYLYIEQGFGDAIMFVRYAPLVAAQGAKVLLCVRPPMKALLAGMNGIVVGVPGEQGPAFQYMCPLLSLPRILKTRIDTIPADVPYIHAVPDRVAKWESRIPDDGKLKVGLVWAGGRDFGGDRARTIGLEQFAPLLGDPHICYVSLHAELRDNDAATLRQHPEIIHFGADLQDFADTAAVISRLDLVISVDTAVAHLAGAMAKPVWILLPFAPDFRWMLGREDSPWYPTARLFRQSQIGDWASVIARVRNALGDRVEARIAMS